MRKNSALRFVSLALLLLPLPALAYEEVEVKDGGTIRGVVRMEGKAPRPGPLEISKFKAFCRNTPNESLVTGPRNGVRYAVVTIEGISKGKAVEKEAVHELDNAACRFVPRVQTASVGQFLLVKNNDPILHTAHAFFANGQPDFNVGLYPGKVSRKPLAAPGVVKILCEVHPWMAAYVAVSEHPYHAVTDAYGEFLISDVPAGKYRLKLWHERLGMQEKEIEVRSGAASKTDFTLSAPAGGMK